MTRGTPAAALAALIGAILIAPAAAQFGIIFGDPPPRPPSSIPGGGAPPGGAPPDANYPPQGYPGNNQSYPSGNAPQGYPPAGSTRNVPGGAPGVQQRQMPPPTGAAANEPTARDPVARTPAQRQTRGTPPVDASPQPGDEVIAEPPAQKIINNAALFSGLDKITGRIISFDVAIGETVQFGALQVTPRACYTRPPTETANTDGFIEVDEVTLQGEVRRIFTGWVFATSPGLHAVEHPIYDIWLTDCKSPVVTAEQRPAEAAPAAAAAATPARAPQRAPQQKRQASPQQPPPQGYPPFR